MRDLTAKVATTDRVVTEEINTQERLKLELELPQ